ncbi:riboflavin biosynthesis protein RibF [Brotaphodocola sp.]|uniref:riboflavin biosynthesis protein RibF n=1 Tax=Brotaphodocola sp. TaxID=3073577 RepID=UPI003D7E4CD4
MQVITGTREFQISEPTVVTIGKFDGRHKGHQKLLRKMQELKERLGLRIAVFTFDMAPMGVVTGHPVTVITTNEERRRKLERMGVDYLVEYPFNREIAHMDPESFVKKILLMQMNAKAIVAGPDCSFGYMGAGNVELLRMLSDQYGFEAVIIEKEQDEHRDISSTYVREELAIGNIEKANELLGEPYTIGGTVVHGNHLGGPVLGFPTVNLLPPPEKHLPPFGVYVTRVLIDEDGAAAAGEMTGENHQNVFGGISNIGRKPTISGDNPVSVETYIMGFDGNLYGKQIEVQFLNFERPETKFESLEALKEQIGRDREYGEKYFREHPELLKNV